MVRHAPIHRRSGHSDIAICCGRNVRGSSPSTSVVPLSNQVTTLNHKRFKGFKMFSDGHLEALQRRGTIVIFLRAVRRTRPQRRDLIDLIGKLCPEAMNNPSSAEELLLENLRRRQEAEDRPRLAEEERRTKAEAEERRQDEELHRLEREAKFAAKEEQRRQ